VNRREFLHSSAALPVVGGIKAGDDADEHEEILRTLGRTSGPPIEEHENYEPIDDDVERYISETGEAPLKGAGEWTEDAKEWLRSEYPDKDSIGDRPPLR
jgi:hypothetical protein